MDIMQTLLALNLAVQTYVATRLRGLARVGREAQPPRAAESKGGQN